MYSDIYLDANATSPVLPAAAAAAEAAMRDGFGNPSSTHATGLRARAMLEEARATARRVVGAGEGSIVFTSGATEGIQTAVLSALCDIRARRAAGQPTGDLLLYGATEHKAVPEALAHWNRLLGTGLELRALEVDQCGRHRLDVLRELAPRAAMVCTMAANNETGVVSDLAGIAQALQGSAALWMVDSVQALGKLQLNLAATRIDYAPFSGHKLYAPKGIGMLYVRAGAPYTPLMCGGGQEGGMRSGTENMAGIAAFGAVLAALEKGRIFRSHAELVELRDRLASAVRAALPGVVFNNPLEQALPTTLNFSVPGLSSKDVLDVFDAAGMRVSSGSACSSAKAAPSYVLQAMDLPEWCCAAAVRMSFGPMVDRRFIDEACARIARCGQVLRESGMLGGEGKLARQDGVVQISADGACCHLVTDAASGQCAVLGANEALQPKVEAYLRAHGYRAVAVPPEGIVLGGRTLLPLAGGYQLRDAAGVPAYVFGDAMSGATEGTIVCPTIDPQGMICSLVEPPSAAAALQSVPAAQLESWLRTHPDALLVDLREDCEVAAAGALQVAGRTPLHVPLSGLLTQLPRWLSGPRTPLLLFCRAGNRSARAAACLQRLGYTEVFSLAGGIALAGFSLEVVPLAA
jgi:cysteine sulfinate desulfinase/cysteine desulfurase-like protein/rhodanese-related sulfurtransferase